MATTGERIGPRASSAWPTLHRISQVMQPRMVLVRRDEPLGAAMAALHTQGARYAVVMNGAEVEGVVAMRDLDALPWMIRKNAASSTADWMMELLVEDVMRRPPLVLAPGASLAHAERLLRDGGRDAVVVVSEGRAVGVVTRDELMGPPTEDGGQVGGGAGRG
jgi:CBS domain-containing protein